ncbi:hypothetical protein [Novosphingobium sp.]|uniref:hypothetical protein n=1 Tax=Novosphingobium sp. TaxID=1874826 RepID=UPI0025F39493|nr:hypothetical protein [Novosphingobium sp.]
MAEMLDDFACRDSMLVRGARPFAELWRIGDLAINAEICSPASSSSDLSFMKSVAQTRVPEQSVMQIAQ